MTDEHDTPERCPHCHHRWFQADYWNPPSGPTQVTVECCHCGHDPNNPVLGDVPLHAADADIDAFVADLVGEDSSDGSG